MLYPYNQSRHSNGTQILYLGMKSNRFIFFIALVVHACTAEMHYTLINYNNGEFKYAPMLQGDEEHHIFITGKKSNLKDTYKLEKFCLYYTDRYKIELKERHSITLWLMSKEYFSMDQIHDENFIAALTVRCSNSNMIISRISIFKNENKDYPIDYPPKNDHDAMPCQ
jgi:hypothetical protein